ncbi:MAG: hypothetical protein H0V46_01235, partial [Sphingomonas sp.]|nr:hypothetical protein [Sphingomonas sp.]
MARSLTLSAATFWRDYPRETVALGVLGVAAAAALAGAAYSTPTIAGLGLNSGKAAVAPPAPPPLLVRQLAPADALSVNQSIPVASGPNPAARPFALQGANETSRGRALECLTSAVYYEA